ncbi:MAG TPA: hypothetical protein VKS21_06160, partial [Spirochaetota bacterium]|nr:hypothetical protein [Spirochaetota bacterium]
MKQLISEKIIKKFSFFKKYRIFFFTTAAFCCLLILLGVLMSPNMLRKIKPPDKQELSEIEKLRSLKIDPDNPPVIQKDVDYNRGKSAAWYPKKEA